jgi:hypothetical protein
MRIDTEALLRVKQVLDRFGRGEIDSPKAMREIGKISIDLQRAEWTLAHS